MLGPRKGNVEALKKLVDHDHPRLYQSFTYEEYRILKVSINKTSDKLLHTREVLELLPFI